MKKPELAKKAARERGVEPGTAADQLDRAVTRIVRALRSGQPAHLPGLGTISPGKSWKFAEEEHER